MLEKFMPQNPRRPAARLSERNENGVHLSWPALLHGTKHNFWVMEVILHRFIISAHVDSINNSMMPLYA